jgi:hypothetical protein
MLAAMDSHWTVWRKRDERSKGIAADRVDHADAGPGRPSAGRIGNSQGQLGDGSIGGTSGLVQVGGLARVSQVSAGGQFSLSVYTPPLVAL